jgi:glyoxylate reductase
LGLDKAECRVVARVLVTRRVPGGALDRLAAAHEMDLWEGPGPMPRAALVARARDVEGLLAMLTDVVDDELLDAAPRLKAVANYAVGFDNVDLAACRARGIAVGNTPDVLTAATADLAMALVLALARRLPEAAADVRDGRWRTWEPARWLGLELEGARLAVIGSGRIGRAVARRAGGFGMEVQLVGRGDDLGAALARADVVTLHAPLTAETRHLIDAAALARMRPGALLVNTARGGLVDQRALLEALRAGHLGGAALDVTDPEPLPADDPLLALPGVIVVPHVGSATQRTRERMAEMAVENVLAGIEGRALPFPA